MACNEDRVFVAYKSTPIEGWERNGSVAIPVPPLSDDGAYDVSLLLRTDNSFPFKNIIMVVETEVFPSGSFSRDTLECELSDDKGLSLGDGINLYQHSFPVETLNLCAGDSVHFSIRHNMMRDMLPGVSDVGILIEDR